MLRFSKDGILLADVPGSGVAKTAVGQKSGNKLHDTRSGKFGSGGGGGRKKVEPPANVDPVEYSRMLDAVREAAREFETMDEGDIKDFLQGRAKAPEQVDIQQFLDAVTQQRKNDLVDWLDQTLRSTGPLKRARRKVRISMPKGYLRKMLGSLDDDSIGELSHRLEAMGHDSADVEAFFEKRLKPDRHENQKARRDALAASDSQQFTLGGMAADPEWDEDDDATVEAVSEHRHRDAIEMAEKIVQNLPQPVVNVHVEVPKPGPTKNTVVRDESNGTIQYTISEPIEDAS